MKHQFQIADMSAVQLTKDRDLLDPNFSGYKLSLESVSVSSVEVSASSAAEHQQPGSGEYGYLHAKLYGEHNHLTVDPWAGGVFWVSRTGDVVSLTQGRASTVWEGGRADTGPRYNSNLVFIGRSEAVVSDGRGRLHIIHTGDRSRGSSSVWRTVFSDLVCGKDRPFLVVTGEFRETGDSKVVEVVVQYVEEVEGEGFRNVLEWISFCQAGSSLVMDRVRRVVTKGGVNTAALVQGRLVISAEKQPKLVFDSMAGLDEVTDAELELATDPGERKAKFYWRQSEEDVEVWCYGGEGVSKTSVEVSLAHRLEVSVCGQSLLAGELCGPVESDSWTWTLEGGKLAVLFTKRNPSHWDSIWSQAGGTLGQEVTDLTEDTCLANLTTEAPIVGENNSSTFNSEQLEDCDDCETSDCLTWFGGDQQLSANLSGHQHLFCLVENNQAKKAIVARHDVDGLVWSLEEDGVRHVATFPALGYVQASKTSRKYLGAPASCGYSVICDNSRHLYIYRQPQKLAAETELRNRKSGQRVEKVAVQQVITLESQTDIIGCAALQNSLVVLTKDRLFSVQV